jgi:hypothetical protein
MVVVYIIFTAKQVEEKMKKSMSLKLFIFPVLLVLFSSLLISGSAGSDVELKVKANSAKVRLLASPESQEIGTVSKGEIFKAEKKEGEWYFITFKNKVTGFNNSGYIHESDVEIVVKEQVVTKPPIKKEKEAEPIQQEVILKEDKYKKSKGFPVSFYLSGNYNFVSGKDLNTWIDSFEEIYSEEDDYFDWNRLKDVYQINFEIIYNLSEYFGLGIGVGYLFRSNYGNYGWRESGGDYSDHTRDINLSAFVLSAIVRGTLPVGDLLSVNFVAGGDYYLGKYKQVLNRDWDYWYLRPHIIFVGWYPIIIYIPTHSSGISERIEDTSCNTFGFHIGTEFAINISRGIATVIGAYYRYVKFNDYFGTYNYTNKTSGYTNNYEGYLWYDTEDPYMRIYEEQPEGWRKAVMNLSGISVLLGIRVSLADLIPLKK